MSKNKIVKIEIFNLLILLSLLTYSCGLKLSNRKFYSSIRPNEEMQLHTLYIDTLEYIYYDDNYDHSFISVRKGNEVFGRLICNDIHQKVSDLNLNNGDIVEIQWKIDSLHPEGDKELLSFREHVMEITKISDKELETPTKEIKGEKSFKVNYDSGNSTKFTLRNIKLEVDKPIISVEFWAERYKNGEWRFATSDYYYLYYKENRIQKIEDPGLRDNLLKTNPEEWVTAFREFANEVPSLLDEYGEDIEEIKKLLWDSGIDIAEVETEYEPEIEVVGIEIIEVNRVEERHKHWKTGEFLDEIEIKEIKIPLLNENLVISDGAEFPCIGHQFRGSVSYFEIKRRNGKFVIREKNYNTINEGIEDYLKNDLLKGFYKNEEQWEKEWKSFVKNGGLKKAIDFINEIIDDEFLDSPLNEIYG